jgi:hypothetical protein
VGPQLAALVRQHPLLKLRRIDVVSWHSPVAEQFSIRSLPTLWLYENGELVTKDSNEISRRLSALK